MKRLIIILFLFINLTLFGQQEHLPVVAWRTNITNVTMLTDSTYRVTVKPLNINEPGGMTRIIGNYLKDFVGHTYLVIDSASTTIDVDDVFSTGYGPQSNRQAVVYRSIGNGEAPYLAPIRYDHLDKSAFDYSRSIELSVLWEYLSDKIDSLFFHSETGYIVTYNNGELVDSFSIDDRYMTYEDFTDSIPTIFLTRLDSSGFSLDTTQIRDLLTFVENHAPATDLSNYVTLNTNQDITGRKTFLYSPRTWNVNFEVVTSSGSEVGTVYKYQKTELGRVSTSLLGIGQQKFIVSSPYRILLNTPELQINGIGVNSSDTILFLNEGIVTKGLLPESEMIYPDAGIPVSTGSAWGTSITDNSSNWNTAYGWGDHSTEGYLTAIPGIDDVLGVGNYTTKKLALGSSVAPSSVFEAKSASDIFIAKLIGQSSLTEGLHIQTAGTTGTSLLKMDNSSSTNIYNFLSSGLFTFKSLTGHPTSTPPGGGYGGLYMYDNTLWFYNGSNSTVYDLLDISGSGGSSLWTEDTNGITYSSGNVGIGGASSIIYDLNITGSAYASTAFISDMVRANSYFYTKNVASVTTPSGDYGKIWMNSADDKLYFTNSTTTFDLTAGASGGGVTSVGITSSDFSISGSPVTTSGNITVNLANDCVQYNHLNDNIISGQSALTSGLVGTDELMISDAGTIKRMDVSVLQTYMQNNLIFGEGGGGVTSVAAGNGMNFTTITSTGNVTMGTPSSITTSSTNGVTTTSHTHTLDLSGRSVSTQYSLTGGGNLGSNRTLNLVGDVATPGNSKYYGTNSSGTRGFYDLPSGGSGLWTDAGTVTYLTSTTDKVSIGKSSNTGEMLEVNGNVKATNFILSSERSLKTNIKDIDNLSRFDNIPIHQFNFKEDSQRIRYGVIVDEVEKVAPELIYGKEGNNTVAYIDLLIAKIARLEQRVSELEERLK